MAQIQFPDFMAVTFGLVTYLLGEAINDRVPLLRRFSIPDPVTGGLLVALLFFALHATGIADGRLRHPRPRPPAARLLHRHRPQRPHRRPRSRAAAPRHPRRPHRRPPPRCRTSSAASPPGSPACRSAMGVVLGSTSLLGGHGTIIAWSPELVARGLAGAPEIGIAMATLGLVVASVIGGPIGRFLIERRGLRSDEPAEVNPVGLSDTAPSPSRSPATP